MKKIQSTTGLLAGIFGAALLLGGCSGKTGKQGPATAGAPAPTTGSPLQITTAPASSAPSPMADFVVAARVASPAVVHIKTTYAATPETEAYGQPYGAPGGERVARASGSGILITPDGYIATNNHVVENASAIQVILPDKRQFAAELVGRDPNTDLALLKIAATELPTLQFGNSDSVQVGQWVVAVGYPFSLNTTVTAGIVSAKARSIGIINRPRRSNDGEPDQAPAGNAGVESFIQTDAAINPGNSGGALVNTRGELVGINSAIASQTGSYAGYAFAIPVNLAKKILGDLQQFGTVRRGVLGVAFPAPAAEEQYLRQQGLQPGAVAGVYITGVLPGSAAATAGLREGDVIQRIDGVTLSSSAEFSERVARHRPGDVVQLTYLRDRTPSTVSVTLKGEPTTAEAPSNTAALTTIREKLGARFAPLPDALRQRYQLRAGVLVAEVREGGFFAQLGVPSGTVIAFINGQSIATPQDIDAALLAAQRGLIQLLAIAPDGSRVVFNFSLGT
ncbi:PDZ domain-containing protein [Hymenobacter sp. RP-2-7]|uniref:PDZ domain-containing protein n=1 Tax=Hymenobacter polaris TaxID=2682546 RepID=A0A7Y0AAP1_9BACT|nr:trypsin-like peptidase domain-containing protein [Hymenobacter polaris]NML63859.1 PDZ domain-containing protein [Hymenobacter polaris]